MLAGGVVDVQLGALDHFERIVEFVRLGGVGDVAGMDHEGGIARHRENLVDRRA